jgi:hypothetical protein
MVRVPLLIINYRNSGNYLFIARFVVAFAGIIYFYQINKINSNSLTAAGSRINQSHLLQFLLTHC